MESLNRSNLAQLTSALSLLTAPELLAWVLSQGGRKVFTTSLGAEDQVLLDLIAKSSPSVEANLHCVTLDTGRLPPETYDVLAANAQHFPSLPIQVFYPQNAALEALVNQHGINLFRQSVALRQACCAVRKVEPLNRALQGTQIWLSGLRRDQASSRQELKVIEWDEDRQLYKIAPLWNWTRQEVEDYLKQHSLPRNALLAQGFPSIGCAPCTRAIKPGEDERAGRWWWEAAEHKECGLHLKTPKTEALASPPKAQFGFTALKIE